MYTNLAQIEQVNPSLESEDSSFYRRYFHYI